MIKVNKMTLGNGLTLILIKDEKKNAKSAHLVVKTGGYVKEFNMDGKDYSVRGGIAHFLEHYLLEKSIYGNIMQIFGGDYISANGLTGLDNTIFYINTVHDFEDNLVKLLNVVNNPAFDSNNIEDIKIPILREIDKAQDRPHLDEVKFSFEHLFRNIPFDPVLGTKEDIEKMTIDDIRLFHKAFYNAKNEILVISGNIDEDKIIDLVNKTYNNFIYSHDTKIKEIEENDEVVSSVCKTKDTSALLKVVYKINVEKFTPVERDKLSYYISYSLSDNFSSKSEIYNYIINNKISSFGVRHSFDFGFSKKYLVISLILKTDRFDEAKDLLMNKMNNLEFKDDSFKIWKNTQIITLINRQENFEAIVTDFIDNINLYNHYAYDDIDFVKGLNMEECKELMGRLDLSNYCVTICEKKDEE